MWNSFTKLTLLFFILFFSSSFRFISISHLNSFVCLFLSVCVCDEDFFLTLFQCISRLDCIVLPQMICYISITHDQKKNWKRPWRQRTYGMTATTTIIILMRSISFFFHTLSFKYEIYIFVCVYHITQNWMWLDDDARQSSLSRLTKLPPKQFWGFYYSMANRHTRRSRRLGHKNTRPQTRNQLRTFSLSFARLLAPIQNVRDVHILSLFFS